MEAGEWTQLLAQADHDAQHAPRRYERRVARFAMLGYAVVLLWLLGLLGLLAFFVYAAVAWKVRGIGLLQLLLVTGTPVVLMLPALRVALPAPDGVTLRRSEVPELFAAVDAVNAAVQGPPLSVVMLDDEMNAAMMLMPRYLGLFGSRGYLVVGLPLLEALPRDEFDGVLAHELAHHSRRHGRFTRAFYRREVLWEQLHSGLNGKARVTGAMVRRFFDWYLPRLYAYTFPLIRAHEREADAIAAAAVGAEARARALIRNVLADAFLGYRYWPAVWARAAQEPTPPDSVLTDLGGAARNACADAGAPRWLDAALQRDAAPDDTHPSLAERLAALNVCPTTPTAFEGPSAADVYLGKRKAVLCGLLDRRWQAAVSEEWSARYQQACAERAELSSLERQRRPLDVEERYRLADLTEDHRSSEDAVELLRELLADAPTHARARFSLGRILLNAGDDAGIAELETAMQLDPDAILPGCAIAAEYLRACDRETEAAQFEERAVRRTNELELASKERETWDMDETFTASDLSDETARGIRACVTDLPEVEAVYVARRHLAHLDEEVPAYVVLVDVDKVALTMPAAELEERLAHELELPGTGHLLLADASDPWADRLRSEAGTAVFDRSREDAPAVVTSGQAEQARA